MIKKGRGRETGKEKGRGRERKGSSRNSIIKNQVDNKAKLGHFVERGERERVCVYMCVREGGGMEGGNNI